MRWLLLLLTLSLSLTACDNAPSKVNLMQELINQKTSKDLSAIGTMSAKYEAVFAHYRHETLGFDDIFIQKALYSVIYGFNLSEAKINVEEQDDGSMILNVSLPTPREITAARDRRTLEINRRFQNFNPTDKSGKKINVSQALDRNVQKQINRYQKQHIEQARKMTRQYFQALADNYGLELKYTMK
jgi:hypothetical protein